MENYHAVLNFKWGFSVSALLALEAEEHFAGESALGPGLCPLDAPTAQHPTLAPYPQVITVINVSGH